MLSPARAALALALCLGASAGKGRDPYYYNIYAQVYLRSVRKISAQDSSFIVEGQINYAYRQDGLFYMYADNAEFPGTGGLVTVLTDGCKSVDGLSACSSTGCTLAGGCIIDTTRGAGNWLGVNNRLKLAPLFPSQTSSLYNAIAWTVSYGVPSFTGLNDTALYAPAASLETAREWLYKTTTQSDPTGQQYDRNTGSTIIAECLIADKIVASARLTCSEVKFTDGGGNKLSGQELQQQMTCDVTVPGPNPDGVGAILRNGSGLVWDFTSSQTKFAGLAKGGSVFCSLFGVPPVQAWVVGTQRFGGVFLQPQLLQDFPFDTQTAGFAIEASDGTVMYNDADVTFLVPSGASSTLIPAAGADGWKLQGSTAAATSRYDKNLGATFSQAVRYASGRAKRGENGATYTLAPLLHSRPTQNCAPRNHPPRAFSFRWRASPLFS
jgi:hypothetical protein